METGTFRVKSGLAEMLKGGVIMDVVTAEQARIADDAHHIDKWAFGVPFVCGATNLGEALRRIAEGAAMIRSKGEAGTGNVVEAVRHMRSIVADIRRLNAMGTEELMSAAKELRAPYDLVRWVAENGRLPVVLFCAGGGAA